MPDFAFHFVGAYTEKSGQLLSTDQSPGVVENDSDSFEVGGTYRRASDNYAEFEALYGWAVPEMAELPLPRGASRRQAPQRILQRLSERPAVFTGTRMRQTA